MIGLAKIVTHKRKRCQVFDIAEYRKKKEVRLEALRKCFQGLGKNDAA
ncbi:MAG: hypothetical protein ACPL5F_10505 [Moorellaceae bacterium]